MDEPPPPEDEGRQPPNDFHAEQGVLGAILSDVTALDDVLGVIYEADFYRPHHGEIFTAIVDLYTIGEPVDAVTVANLLTKRGLLDRVGGAPYLVTLLGASPISVNAGYYADIIREQALLRRIAAASVKISQLAYGREGDAAAIFDAAISELHAAEGTSRGQDYVSIHEVLPETLDAIDAHTGTGEMLGVPTGFYDLDELTNGLHPGQMVCVAGRPSMGKSTLAVDFARSAAIRHNLATCVFSLEMSRDELARRIISAEAKVTLDKINTGMLSEQDWTKIGERVGAMSDAPLYFDDSPNLTMNEIAVKARRLKAQVDLRLIVIDYLQLMTSGKRVENRQVEVSEFSRHIKILAKELRVPVIVLSQLNRGVEQRTNKRPMLSDLRESGAIEQDSDVVILVHRDDMYEQESNRPGEADLIVAKHRNGPTRDVTVVFQGHYSRFVDMAR